MTAAILCIGTELLRGEILNRNQAWLADRLTGLGLEVAASEEIADEMPLIEEALGRLGSRHTLIAVTGGLGPTTDDLTREAVAALLNVPLELHPESLAAIEERLRRAGRHMAPSNRKQATFPKGASVIPNPHGTAPGFALTIGRARAVFMPGVPSEMHKMFDQAVAPLAEGLRDDAIVQLRLKLFGLPESEVNERLAGLEAEYSVVIAYRAHFPEIEVKILSRDGDATAARARADAAGAEVRRRLGSVIYGEGDVHFAESVGAVLRERGLTLGLAESCTGGLVAKLLTESPASDYFVGSVVSYANAVKQNLLGVDGQTLEAYGAVSREVAEQMALGARRQLGADVALSLTGIAGPSGGSADKPVGLVHYAVASAGGITSRELTFPRTRWQIQRYAAYAGLNLVRRVVTRGHG